jgi:hypothetical protein
LRRLLHFALLACLGTASLASAQEASAGIDLRATLTAQMVGSNDLTAAPRSGSPVILGSRAVVYPTIKFSDNWFITGAVQLVTRPYYYEDLSNEGYGAKGSVLQATLNYSRVSQRGSLLLRAGEISSAFGSFLLRYDDADNPLIDLPAGYGYYYAPVSFLPVAGAQVDAARGRFDGRLQFANSSPANPRSIFAHDQYGNWAGGGGYTIRQGFRVGVSGYRGPYLDRHYAFFFPGEANPSRLPARGLGLDANWAHGHTSTYMELQRFRMSYHAIPNFHESTAYGEVKQELSPRWYIAARYSYACNNPQGAWNTYEAAAGFRPDRWQLLKFGYEEERFRASTESPSHIVGVQFITSFHKDMGLGSR